MKLYSVEIIREQEEAVNVLVVAQDSNTALEKTYAEYEIDSDDVYKYFIYEISVIDGYKILLEKVEDHGFAK